VFKAKNSKGETGEARIGWTDPGCGCNTTTDRLILSSNCTLTDTNEGSWKELNITGGTVTVPNGKILNYGTGYPLIVNGGALSVNNGGTVQPNSSLSCAGPGCWKYGGVCDATCNGAFTYSGCGRTFQIHSGCSTDGTGNCYRTTGGSQIICCYDDSAQCTACYDWGNGCSYDYEAPAACTWAAVATPTPTPCWRYGGVCDAGCANVNLFWSSCSGNLINPGGPCAANGSGSCYKNGASSLNCCYDDSYACNGCIDVGNGCTYQYAPLTCTWQ
jgi:hypothetical protein